MRRIVDPEWLDSLPADDPRAVRSRNDLRRINVLMRNQSVLGTALNDIVRAATRVRLVEIGAGDGTLLLRLARRHAKCWPNVALELLDLQPVVRGETLDDFHELGWSARVIGANVFEWLAQAEPDHRPIVVANLFLHHFKEEPLRELLRGIASRAQAFVCCEPRRSRFALAGSHLLGLIGGNDVTRHDAVVSVRAGFNGDELSALWPQRDGWMLQESWAAPFGHRFIAVRDSAQGNPPQ